MRPVFVQKYSSRPPVGGSGKRPPGRKKEPNVPRRKKSALQEQGTHVATALTAEEVTTLKLALSIWLWNYEGSSEPTMAKMALRIRKIRDVLEQGRP
jgi:hypothetical protein